MVSTGGFGFFSDFAEIVRWAGLTWRGQYSGQYPYPLMVLLAPLSLVPVDVAAIVAIVLMLLALVLTLKREARYWVFFVPVLQTLYLGQLDIFFWLLYRSGRPALWALLSLKPQLLLPVLPRLLASRRTAVEFLGATAALHLPFLLIRPSWPAEWVHFLLGFEQNRLTRVPASTTTGSMLGSPWIIAFAAALVILFFLRRRNLEGLLFLANPALLPYDYSLLTGGVSRIAIPLSWVALWAAWRVKAGWPYALLLLAVLTFETMRERQSAARAPS
jgi:hypothetical protein